MSPECHNESGITNTMAREGGEISAFADGRTTTQDPQVVNVQSHT